MDPIYFWSFPATCLVRPSVYVGLHGCRRARHLRVHHFCLIAPLHVFVGISVVSSESLIRASFRVFSSSVACVPDASLSRAVWRIHAAARLDFHNALALVRDRFVSRVDCIRKRIIGETTRVTLLLCKFFLSFLLVVWSSHPIILCLRAASLDLIYGLFTIRYSDLIILGIYGIYCEGLGS